MVRITNGTNIFEVTNGAYKNNFKNLGYSIIEDKKETSEEKKNSFKGNIKHEDKKSSEVKPEPQNDIPVEEESIEEVKEKDFVTMMEETPISQWNKEDTKRFAQEKGIDVSEAKSLKEAKEIISEAIK